MASRWMVGLVFGLIFTFPVMGNAEKQRLVFDGATLIDSRCLHPESMSIPQLTRIRLWRLLKGNYDRPSFSLHVPTVDVKVDASRLIDVLERVDGEEFI